MILSTARSVSGANGFSSSELLAHKPLKTPSEGQASDRISPRVSPLGRVPVRHGYEAAKALFCDAARALTGLSTNPELDARYEKRLKQIYYPEVEPPKLVVTPDEHFRVDEEEHAEQTATDAPLQQQPVEQPQHAEEPLQPAPENEAAAAEEEVAPEHPPVHEPVAPLNDNPVVLEPPSPESPPASDSDVVAPEAPVHRSPYVPTPALHVASEPRFVPPVPSSTIREIADPVTAIVSKAPLPAAQSRPAAMAKPVTQPTSKIAGLPQPKQLPSASEPVVDTAVAAEQPTVAAETAVVILATTGVIALTVASIVGLLALHRPKLPSPAAVDTHERQALLSKEYKINDPWDGISHPGALLVAC